MDTPTHCPLCGGEQIVLFYAYPEFRLYACQQCALVFQWRSAPLPPESLSQAVYNEDWVAFRDRCSQKTFAEHASFNTLLLNIFFPHKGSLLEIGAGTGEFLFFARESGWQTVGIEPSPFAVAYAKAKFGLELINSPWQADLLPPGRKFTAIAFWHVLEHLAAPIAFLKEVVPFLAPNGLLFFSVPNCNSFTNQLLGPASPLYTEPDHLFHYSPPNLLLLLAKADLSAITLFSREEINRFQLDMTTALERDPRLASLTLTEAMGLWARLQAHLEGHELFCVARPAATP